ncbi:hypothetical protein LTR91_019792 [Friedmanniomyces endolithicus]|uniref:Uncharacterized protein n=1 Tax=Friedmanniomyces endolithicus TaxID=329885 RepID=A0AAN6K1S2_9PEZI|nr:hypothetical protein LTR91_019792 [Friedmanniomyces endolithicus]
MNIRLTPSNSPYFKSSVPRSPTKFARTEEPGLRLSTVIGTTTSTANGFDVDAAKRKFAYTAGAAAVVCSVDRELKLQQRFFRARPTSAGAGRDVNGQSISTPTPGEARNRAVGHVKEYSLGGSPLGASRDWTDSANGKTGTAKDRVKAVTSVALSANGKWLAVGETGYKPRILIFSLAEDAQDTPVVVLSEHTFGVHALRFSPDSKYLASLGTVNDGFLYVWQIDDRTGAAALHASNKCTTFINSMAWMGTSIVTVGLRFVKVWRPDEDAGIETRRADTTLSPTTPRLRAENRSSDFGNSILSPRHKVLAGKNSLLGEVLDCNFICALPISATEMIVSAESGEICFLDNTGESPTLSHVTTADWRICSAMLDGPGILHVFGVDDTSSTFAVSDLRNGPADPGHRSRRKTISPYRQLNETTGTPVAVASMDGLQVRLYSRGGVVISRDISDATQPSCVRLSGPADAVAGVAALDSDASRGPNFFTYSGKGILQTWDAEGGLVEQCTVPLQGSEDMYGTANMLTAAAPFSNGLLVASGDKLGALSVLDLETGSILTQLRAHSSEIADIRAFQRSDQNLLATASRDRTVQLFAWTDSKLELLQTMDEHAAAVTSLLATEDGQLLLSCSADRSVVVREAWLRDPNNLASVAYVILRTITLKSAPTSMCMGADQSTLFVASTDRSITKFNIKSGQTIFTFKCADSDGGEAVARGGGGDVEDTIRAYVERQPGHRVAMLAPARGDDEVKATRLVTVAADSTIFLWDTSPASTPSLPQQTLDGTDTIATPKATVSMGPPLRKVMSYASLTRLRRESSLEDSDPSLPAAAQTPTQASSPQRLRKKASRMSIAPAPRLEPALRSSFAESSLRSSRRSSLRQRSPSPASPRNPTTSAASAARTSHRSRPSLSSTLRSKSSENVLKSFASPLPTTATSTTNPSAPSTSTFGSLTSATESASRTLRAYRKRLANAPPPSSNTTELISPEALRELEKELKLTARALGERSRGGTVDEGTMARLLDQASEKIVGMLDERIRERVEREVLRKSWEGLPEVGEAGVGSVVGGEGGEGEGADALAGALEGLGVGE